MNPGMKSVTATEFDKTWRRLTGAAEVTAYGRVIGVWTPSWSPASASGGEVPAPPPASGPGRQPGPDAGAPGDPPLSARPPSPVPKPTSTRPRKSRGMELRP